ncbi:MAG: hypothetical protein IT204_01125 [Fimbriimonadaceae bacterium]|nr:hypothetical protein [Fimbriimonadaceae bacterium]
MNPRVLTVVLSVGLLFSSVSLAMQLVNLRPPGNNQGYEPQQPIAYSHRLHAGELQIPCQYCHSGASRSKHAGIPAASTCLNCHQFVTASLGAVRAADEAAKKAGRAPQPVVSAELRKLYDSLGLDARLQRDPQRPVTPIAWQRIHQLPDFATFDHRAHVAAEVPCQQCHGPVETMERVRQQASLSMGWCVACHRTTKATPGGRPLRPSTDCATCHQ